MIVGQLDGDGGVAAEDAAVIEVRGERAVEGHVRQLRKSIGEVDAGAVAELAPFPRPIAELGVTDHRAGVEDLDVTAGHAAGDETRGGHHADKAVLGRQRLLVVGPERMRRRQQERGETLGRPVRRGGTGILLNDFVEAVGEAGGEAALLLIDGAGQEEIEVARAEPAQSAGSEVSAVFHEREAEDIEAVETVGDRAAEGGMLPAGGEEMLIVGDK